jgi:hypothetical protein
MVKKRGMQWEVLNKGNSKKIFLLKDFPICKAIQIFKRRENNSLKIKSWELPRGRITAKIVNMNIFLGVFLRCKHAAHSVFVYGMNLSPTCFIHFLGVKTLSEGAETELHRTI